MLVSPDPEFKGLLPGDTDINVGTGVDNIVKPQPSSWINRAADHWKSQNQTSTSIADVRPSLTSSIQSAHERSVLINVRDEHIRVHK